MRGFFEEIEKLHIQYKAVENLDGFEKINLLTKEEVKRVKKEIKERVVKTIELNIPKFRNNNIN